MLIFLTCNVVVFVLALVERREGSCFTVAMSLSIMLLM